MSLPGACPTSPLQRTSNCHRSLLPPQLSLLPRHEQVLPRTYRGGGREEVMGSTPHTGGPITHTHSHPQTHTELWNEERGGGEGERGREERNASRTNTPTDVSLQWVTLPDSATKFPHIYPSARFTPMAALFGVGDVVYGHPKILKTPPVRIGSHWSPCMWIETRPKLELTRGANDSLA